MKDYKRKLQFKMLNIVKKIDRVYKLYNIDYYFNRLNMKVLSRFYFNVKDKIYKKNIYKLTK